MEKNEMDVVYSVNNQADADGMFYGCFSNWHPHFSGCKMREAFWVHFHDHFAHCPDLPVQEFCSNLADFPRFQEAEAASYEGMVTKCEVHDALKQISLNKLPGLDGLPYEVYLRLPHMFVPILTYVLPLVLPGSHPW